MIEFFLLPFMVLALCWVSSFLSITALKLIKRKKTRSWLEEQRILHRYPQQRPEES